MDDRLKETIKALVSSRELLEDAGIRVHPRTGMAVCPFHGDHDGSLKVYSDPRRGWYCYGCHAGGDVIDLAQRLYGVGFRDALRLLNERFSMGLDLDRRLSPAEKRAMDAENRRLKEEREREKRAYEEAEADYLQALELWLLVGRAIDELAPLSPDEPMNDGFVWAVTHRAEVEELMKERWERWMDYANGRKRR